MRIVLVVNSLIFGGAETQVIAISRELAARGHRVVIYTLQPDNPRADELEGSGVEIVADRKRWKFDPAVVARLRALLRQREADIVHGFLVDGNLHARLAGAGLRTAVLNSERNDNYRLPMAHRAALLLTRKLTTGLIANTFAGARFAQKLFRLPGDRVHVVWNGIDVQAAEHSASPQRDPRDEFFGSADVKVACLVGMIRPQKDYLLALRVAEALVSRDASWRVLLVGDSLPHTEDYKKRVQRAFETAGLGRCVAFAGLRRDVRGLLRRSNVLFSTSLYEGFPNVVLEAMAAGTPVVSTDYSDIREILPFTWQVSTRRDPAELAGAILRAERERGKVIGEQHAWLAQHATLSGAVDQLERIYERYTPGAGGGCLERPRVAGA